MKTIITNICWIFILFFPMVSIAVSLIYYSKLNLDMLILLIVLTIYQFSKSMD